jgi:FkbM family methyltransferase
MSELYLNSEEIVRWFRDRGDETHNLNYDLNENSTVMDLGGYTGVWVQQIIDKYSPNIYIIEPIPSFYTVLMNKFKDNPKVRLLNVAVGTENIENYIYLSGDASSSNSLEGEKIKVQYNTIERILEKFGLNKIDLIQINIEGDEYPLLENMLGSGTINYFNNIQVQFHLGIKNEISRRDKIREGFVNNGFKNKFNYPFVWESWFK